MDDYWLCPRCSSRVRAAIERCYSCGTQRPRQELRPRPELRPAQQLRPRPQVTLVRDEQAPVLMPGRDDALLPAARATLLRHPFRPVAALGGAVSAALITLLAVDLVRFWAELMLHGLDGRSPGLIAGMPAGLESLLGALRTVEPMIGMIAGSLWFFFLGTSLLNAPALGSGTPSATWFDAVVDWVLPPRNFRRPFEIVGDLYSRLAVPGSAPSKIVRWWWTACLVWYVIIYLPTMLQALEIVMGVLGAILVFAVGRGSTSQPTWTWWSQPHEVVLIVILVLTIGPATILLGGGSAIPQIGVPRFPSTLPGLFLIEDLQLLLRTASFLGEAAFVAAMVLWLRIVAELAQRQNVRAAWLRSPTTVARAGAVNE